MPTHPRQRHSAGRLLATTVACLAMSWGAALAGVWASLGDSGIYDSTNPALGTLQNPAEAFNRLPADSAGNQVDWHRALNDGYIRPRSRLREDRPVEILDSVIVMKPSGGIPRVEFPHRAHTQWLDCSNCHDRIFAAKAGGTPMTMGKILEGEYCGVCHGAVAFPLTECNRCHTGPAN